MHVSTPLSTVPGGARVVYLERKSALATDRPTSGTAGVKLERKAAISAPAPAPDSAVIGIDEDEGVVTAIVSVTNVLDEVGDVILAGAYKDTLKKRNPKGIWSHGDDTWVARTEEAAELLPEDERLPKQTKTGDPWPKEAGAALVKARFNLETQAGREAFSNVKFFGTETEWSIGYHVPKGKSVKRGGIRYIKSLEWYEYSPVLFGAHPMAHTLDLKTHRPGETIGEIPDGPDDPDTPEHAPPAAPAPAPAPEPPPVSTGSEGVLEAGSAAAPAPAGDGTEGEGGDPGQLFAAAQDEIDWAEVDEAAGTAPEPSPEPAADQAGGDDDGGGEPGGETKAGGMDSNRGGAEKLRRYWSHGEGAAKIRWGTEGDFDRCVRLVSEHMDPTRAKGYCNLRHKEATGKYAGEKKSTDAASGDQDTSGDAALEIKIYPRLAGSHEERQEMLRAAVGETLRGAERVPSTGDVLSGRVRYEWDHVHVEATYDDHVIACRTRWTDDDGPSTREHWKVPYRWDAERNGIVIGTPEQVELRVVASPTRGGEVKSAALALGDESSPYTPSPVVVTDPIDQAVAGMNVMILAEAETKAGRVLSSANAARIRGAYDTLGEVLRKAGVLAADDGGTGGDAPPPKADETKADPAGADTGGDDGKVVRTKVDPKVLAASYRILADPEL